MISMIFVIFLISEHGILSFSFRSNIFLSKAYNYSIFFFVFFFFFFFFFFCTYKSVSRLNLKIGHIVRLFHYPIKIHLFILLLRPQLYLWGSPFLVRFLRVRLFVDPTVEVVAFRLRWWFVLGVFLLPVFTSLGHVCQDLMSPCDGMCVCTD